MEDLRPSKASEHVERPLLDRVTADALHGRRASAGVEHHDLGEVATPAQILPDRLDRLRCDRKDGGQVERLHRFSGPVSVANRAVREIAGAALAVVAGKLVNGISAGAE